MLIAGLQRRRRLFILAIVRQRGECGGFIDLAIMSGQFVSYRSALSARRLEARPLEGRQISRSMRRVKGCVPLADAQPQEFLSLRR